MLEEVYASYRKLADEVNWKEYNCNDLFREYIKHEHDELKEPFFAGIVCRYWGHAGRLYNQCSHHIPFEECHDCIIDAIRYVLEKRVWEKENSSLYGDPAGPDKAMHVAMKRQKSIMLTQKSAAKRVSNFNTLSIDGSHEDYNDASDGLLFDFDDYEIDNKLRRMISTYFIGDDYTDGLFLDLICYNVSSEGFNSKLIVRSMRELRKYYYSYYKDCYSANEEVYYNTLKSIKKLSNKILNIKLKSLLYRLRKEEEGRWQQL